MKYFRWFVPMAAACLLGAGCFSAQSAEDQAKKAADAVKTSVASRTAGGDVKVNAAEGSVTAKNAAGDVVQFGRSVTIPSDFPKDVPVYPGSTAASVVMATSGDRSSALTLKSDDASAKVVKWYEDRLKADGWTQVQTMSSTGVELRNYTKDSVQLSVTIQSAGEGTTTVIALIRSPKQ